MVIKIINLQSNNGKPFKSYSNDFFFNDFFLININ